MAGHASVLPNRDILRQRMSFCGEAALGSDLRIVRVPEIPKIAFDRFPLNLRSSRFGACGFGIGFSQWKSRLRKSFLACSLGCLAPSPALRKRSACGPRESVSAVLPDSPAPSGGGNPSAISSSK